MKFLDKIQNKKILVVGLGRTGKATLEMLGGRAASSMLRIARLEMTWMRLL